MAASAIKFLALDLEVDGKDRRIKALAAVQSHTGKAFHRKFGGGIGPSTWRELDAFAGDCDYLVGHNLIAWDLGFLRAEAPDLQLLNLPILDTLRLNPLAYPRNPYHKLVKHYKDAELHRGQLNDPQLDCRYCLQVLEEQHQNLQQADPNLLTSWHWLTTQPSHPWDTHPNHGTPTSAMGHPPKPWDTHPSDGTPTQGDGKPQETHSKDKHGTPTQAMGHPLKPWDTHPSDGTPTQSDGKSQDNHSKAARNKPPFSASAQGFDAFFSAVRGGAPRPSDSEAKAAIAARLGGNCCATQAKALLARPGENAWPLAYALAWLSVAGENSVMPPWVRHEFPAAGELVRQLRDTACADANCAWCRERHDARKELKRWFGFDDFRPEPKDAAGKPMQQAIVEAVLAGEPVLGILPTGTGKSLCYQIPALSRYDKTGALTVVISPLVALMADQVAGLAKLGIDSSTTVNGMLSLPERGAALDRVRLGDAGIVLISPEQLRSKVVRQTLEQREVGLWVLDEAHCLSRWGHDFRPDYRYIARFIRKMTESQAGFQAPVLCLTATAKPEVIDEIRKYFQDKLDISLQLFDGGARRENLQFVVVRTTASEKYGHINQLLESDLPAETPGGAIIYCATRKRTEEIAEFLREHKVAAGFFHAGLLPETKKSVQEAFSTGQLRVIVATNAFGMGIDKPDVRLVIHADIPGSLENYLQEAGRAGRDQMTARCILLYTPEDVERQFGLSARSRLARHEIHGILRALRNFDKRKKKRGEVIATSGEILQEDDEAAFERDELTDDTRVRTAVSWLEEAQLLTREENFVSVFPSSLRVSSIAEAKKRIEKRIEIDSYRQQLLRIVERLIDANPVEGITTDELMHVTGLSPEGVRKALQDLESLGVANNDTAVTAYVHRGVPNASAKRFDDAIAMESSLIDELRELAPDLQKGDSESLHLRTATQRLKDLGHESALPERVTQVLRGLAGDGKDESAHQGSITLARRRDRETITLTLNRDWSALRETAERRRAGAHCLLQHLLSRLGEGSQGVDLLAETTFGALQHAIESDLELKALVKNPRKLMERALLWLHELDVIRLNKGLAVFRPAMTIQLGGDWKRGFGTSDFEPLKLHYEDRMLQIHVMEEYAQRGIGEITNALALAMDYFELDQETFLARWLPGRDAEISRQLTARSWREIVESLGNKVQERIVTDPREQTNLLVLAGPGSGKTRVLVHRIAWLLRARRERPHSIIALAYNRHAAVEIRRRLRDLVEDDANGVTVMTCHGLAMRLLGASFSKRSGDSSRAKPNDDSFDEVLRQATALLQGEDLPAEELDENRQRLLAGFRWILVDEYQDIGPEEYALISALSGRTLKEEQDRLSLFAVGDDDQNIYAFAGASVEYIRRFQSDYGARREFLVQNYRSSAHIIDAANALIAPARSRMKPDHPIHVDSARRGEPKGGVWRERDPVASGRVQILDCGDTAAQAQTAVGELNRLAELAGPDWNWSRCAVIAREWKYLDPVRAACELMGIKAQIGKQPFREFWRLRETQALLAWARERNPRIVDANSIKHWLAKQTQGRWVELLQEAVVEYAEETGAGETPVDHFIEWLAEWGRDFRRRQQGLLLVTAHSAKGLEFDHVIVLDGGWDKRGKNEDRDAARRLFYVAMTRARQTLSLTRMEEGRQPFADELSRVPDVLRRKAPKIEENTIREMPASEQPKVPRALDAEYLTPGLEMIDLGYAGRHPQRNGVHGAIRALAAGDALELRAADSGAKRWELFNESGSRVGRLSAKFEHPVNRRCRRAQVFAVVRWNREQSEPEYHDGIRCDGEWEVIVPELVFEPVG